MAYQLIAVDMDGTLLNSKKRSHHARRPLLRQRLRAGITSS